MNLFITALLLPSLVYQATGDGLGALPIGTVVLSPGMMNTEAFAQCPTHLVMVGCSSTGLGYTYGTRITYGRCSTRPNTLAEKQGVAVQARAVCKPASEAGEVEYVASDYVINPVASCAAGYSLIDCMLYTEFPDMYEGDVFPQGVVSGASCTSDRACRDDSTCRTQAICASAVGERDGDQPDQANAFGDYEEKVTLSAGITEGSTYAECVPAYKLIGCSVAGLEYSNGPMIIDNKFCTTSTNLRTSVEGIVVLTRGICAFGYDLGLLEYMESGFGTKPAVSCKSDYTMIDCMLATRKGDMYALEDFPYAVVNENACESSRTCQITNPCSTTVICQKKA